MATPRELLNNARSRITEVLPSEASEMLKQPGAVALDVREADEFEQGALRGAVHIPRGSPGAAAGRARHRYRHSHRGLLRRRGAQRLCGGHARTARLFERRQHDRRVQPLEGRGPALGIAGHPHPRAAQPVPAAPASARGRRGGPGQAAGFEGAVARRWRAGIPAALYLAAAGVGTLGIIDMDVVDASNLQRQILHNLDRIGERKVDSAKKTLVALNPDVNVVTYDVRLGADNVLDIFAGYDLIVDGTDNFPTRYLVNDASLKLDIPVVHGSIFRFEGQASVYLPHQGPCYRCQVPEPPPADLAPSCAEAGVLGVLPGIIGSIQAMEAIKVLLGLGDPLVGRLLAYDALEGTFRTFKLNRDPDCPACSVPKEELVIAEYDQLCLPHPIAPPAVPVSA